jgi:hypothetical protein
MDARPPAAFIAGTDHSNNASASSRSALFSSRSYRSARIVARLLA